MQSNGTLLANLNPAGTTCSNIVQKDRGGTRGFGNAHAESESGKIKDGFCALGEGTSGGKMEGPLRGILAGAAAWKFGGGCISTILIFIIVFWLLGYVRC
ncbi:MAG: hypothetical protein C5B44_03565 [Acidobacteria bacterium]|nr:MAG: hypothetical protein C5B44_03565 [Acidobacteriota bacterium]